MSDKLVVFNHAYGLKHDQKRTYLFAKEKFSNSLDVNGDWMTRIHPMYAMLFALLSIPVTKSIAIEKISYFFEISTDDASRILDSMLNRNEPFYSRFNGVVSQFPKNVIINHSSDIDIIEYDPSEFRYETLDLISERAIDSPRTVVLMPTNKCSVDCVYCYADKRLHTEIPFDKIKDLVEECKYLRIISISLTGGDIMLYRYWKQLIILLHSNNFETKFISSKTPGDIDDVMFIKNNKLTLQFSLDSSNPQTLSSLISANINYIPRVKKYFQILSDFGINIQVATVLTSLNSSRQEIEDLFNFISQFSCVETWTIRVAMKSLYSNKSFEDFKLSQDKITEISNIVDSIRNLAKFKISWTPEINDKYFMGENGSPSFKGARCSANYSNIMILPDGKVTICEQLYWNPNYLIGDITKQSIREIWNSKRALSLTKIDRDLMQQSNPCKKCKLLDLCNAFPNRCIVDVLKGYGEENSDFPDPRCRKAPDFIKSDLRL